MEKALIAPIQGFNVLLALLERAQFITAWFFSPRRTPLRLQKLASACFRLDTGIKWLHQRSWWLQSVTSDRVHDQKEAGKGREPLTFLRSSECSPITPLLFLRGKNNYWVCHLCIKITLCFPCQTEMPFSSFMVWGSVIGSWFCIKMALGMKGNTPKYWEVVFGWWNCFSFYFISKFPNSTVYVYYFYKLKTTKWTYFTDCLNDPLLPSNASQSHSSLNIGLWKTVRNGTG